MDYIPCTVQYIGVAYFIPHSLYFSQPSTYIVSAPSLFSLPYYPADTVSG